MKTIDLSKVNPDLREVIAIARQEPVLLLAPDGKEYYLSEADDFEREVDALRSSKAFQQVLDQRSASRPTIPLEEVEREVEEELARKKPT
jgi:hypothetical protein